MTALTSGFIEMPTQRIDAWLGGISTRSVVATLSGETPMKFGAGEAMVFDIGEAEYVGEGGNKGPTTVSKEAQTVDPFKFHKTIRFNEEVLWADEDYQLGVVNDILEQIQPALSRALDYGVIHGINPTGGTVVAAMTQNLAAVSNTVGFTGSKKPYEALDEADTLVLGNGFVPRDIALDPSFASAFSTLRGKNSETKLYPNFRLDVEASELDGHRASVSRTVNAKNVIDTPSDIIGVVGDFSAIRWGVQKRIGLELIRYGDPDGGGDLKRKNQVAFRAEVVYGWGIADNNAFALITNADRPSSSGS